MNDWLALAGRVLLVGLPGTVLDPRTEETLGRLQPAGVTLFGRNLDTPEQTAKLLERVTRVLSAPPLLAIDQEGGRVSRLEPWVGPTPAAATFTTTGDDQLARFARLTGDALRGLGFNLDFAPVVDLCCPDDANGIGDRSFDTDPATVIRTAGLFLEQLQLAGVAGCLKHFPGLGHTRVDSHIELPVVTRSREELERADLLPYRELAQHAATVMVGHGNYAAWDAEACLPASGSKAIVTGLLRERLGYGGLIVSDDLEMGAVNRLDTDGQFAVRSLEAGCDLLLYCSDLERADTARRALAAAASANPHIGTRLEQAAKAVNTTATEWPPMKPRLAFWEEARRDIKALVKPVLRRSGS
jgi:beta-N-acetylhexosaminidase